MFLWTTSITFKPKFLLGKRVSALDMSKGNKEVPSIIVFLNFYSMLSSFSKRSDIDVVVVFLNKHAKSFMFYETLHEKIKRTIKRWPVRIILLNERPRETTNSLMC